MFKAHLVMIQRKSANLNPYARETEKGPRPDLVLVEMFKAHLVMIQRKSANPYARETEKGPRPGGAATSS